MNSKPDLRFLYVRFGKTPLPDADVTLWVEGSPQKPKVFNRFEETVQRGGWEVSAAVKTAVWIRVESIEGPSLPSDSPRVPRHWFPCPLTGEGRVEIPDSLRESLDVLWKEEGEPQGIRSRSAVTCELALFLSPNPDSRSMPSWLEEGPLFCQGIPLEFERNPGIAKSLEIEEISFSRQVNGRQDAASASASASAGAAGAEEEEREGEGEAARPSQRRRVESAEERIDREIRAADRGALTFKVKCRPGLASSCPEMISLYMRQNHNEAGEEEEEENAPPLPTNVVSTCGETSTVTLSTKIGSDNRLRHALTHAGHFSFSAVQKRDGCVFATSPSREVKTVADISFLRERVSVFPSLAIWREVDGASSRLRQSDDVYVGAGRVCLRIHAALCDRFGIPLTKADYTAAQRDGFQVSATASVDGDEMGEAGGLSQPSWFEGVSSDDGVAALSESGHMILDINLNSSGNRLGGRFERAVRVEARLTNDASVRASQTIRLLFRERQREEIEKQKRRKEELERQKEEQESRKEARQAREEQLREKAPTLFRKGGQQAGGLRKAAEEKFRLPLCSALAELRRVYEKRKALFATLRSPSASPETARLSDLGVLHEWSPALKASERIWEEGSGRRAGFRGLLGAHLLIPRSTREGGQISSVSEVLGAVGHFSIFDHSDRFYKEAGQRSIIPQSFLCLSFKGLPPVLSCFVNECLLKRRKIDEEEGEEEESHSPDVEAAGGQPEEDSEDSLRRGAAVNRTSARLSALKRARLGGGHSAATSSSSSSARARREQQGRNQNSSQHILRSLAQDVRSLRAWVNPVSFSLGGFGVGASSSSSSACSSAAAAAAASSSSSSPGSSSDPHEAASGWLPTAEDVRACDALSGLLSESLKALAEGEGGRRRDGRSRSPNKDSPREPLLTTEIPVALPRPDQEAEGSDQSSSSSSSHLPSAALKDTFRACVMMLSSTVHLCFDFSEDAKEEEEGLGEKALLYVADLARECDPEEARLRAEELAEVTETISRLQEEERANFNEEANAAPKAKAKAKSKSRPEAKPKVSPRHLQVKQEEGSVQGTRESSEDQGDSDSSVVEITRVVPRSQEGATGKQRKRAKGRS
uniref:Uncharacterized protein n=1 Tax=Chromera velia CCMP2878 TaxID=1169474 RepID=A0A0G4I833_9ALVE|eukprot:Cvel_11765.t1-p1 / transcript=Cvel_11765.t1 / gene=Cvel_11765 / organism=Chromera_velia_CCMP2878 / gene_product=hypothetical protein / transcript_product=hypothetical protein / location=Cvel_scaffold748:16768-22420(-) / protein_length=1103 / sequence_SO=supercontig / SO=protein_coding / is_pseudo=false